MKKFIFTFIIVFLCVSFYAMQRFSLQKIVKTRYPLVKQKKLYNYQLNVLKRFYSVKLNTINPFTFLRKKLGKLWVKYTYRYVDLSKAHKLIAPQGILPKKSIILKGSEKQKTIVEITEKLEDFYKNYFLEILTADGSMATIERVGNMMSVLAEGKYFIDTTERKNKGLVDFILAQYVSEDVIENSIFDIVYDTKLLTDFEKSIQEYYVTEDLEKIIEHIFRSKNSKSRLKKCLSQFCVDILEHSMQIEKDGNHRIKFFELLTKLRKNKLVSNLNSKDEIIALRIILQSFAFMFKTVHIQIIPQASVEILAKDIHHIEKNIGEKIKKMVDIIDEMIKVSLRA